MLASTNSLHIVLFIHSLRAGGAERVVQILSNWWLEQGYRVSIVTQTPLGDDAYVLHPGVQRYSLETAGSSSGRLFALLKNIQRIGRLRRLLRRLQPNVVLGMMTTSSVLAILAAWRLPCQVIASEHTHPPAQRLSPFWKKARRWSYPKAKAVVTLTSATANWVKEHIKGANVVVIPNPVVWPLLSNENRNKADNTLEQAPPDRAYRKRILAVGRLHPVKGFDQLIFAFSSIAAHFPDWDLVILGEGQERQHLESLVIQHNMQARITLPGQVGNLTQWYQESDLYVLSSRTEGLSNTLLEAMASGLAVVATDCPTGPREIIRDQIDGVLVNPIDDYEALAAYMSDLMAHPEKREALARRALDARDRFSAPRITALWEKLF